MLVAAARCGGTHGRRHAPAVEPSAASDDPLRKPASPAGGAGAAFSFGGLVMPMDWHQSSGAPLAARPSNGKARAGPSTAAGPSIRPAPAVAQKLANGRSIMYCTAHLPHDKTIICDSPHQGTDDSKAQKNLESHCSDCRVAKRQVCGCPLSLSQLISAH